MTEFETKCGVTLFVVSQDNFEMAAYDRDRYFTREQLTELRHIIDQALNTSAEELGDVEVKRSDTLANPTTFGKPAFSVEDLGDA